MAPLLCLFVFAWLGLSSERVDGFKIVVIGDESNDDHLIYGEYVNASIGNLVNENITFQYLAAPDDTDRAYREVCGLDMEGASFLISVAEKINVISAVKSASYNSGVPTVQIQYGPWIDGRPKPGVSVPKGARTAGNDLYNSTSFNITIDASLGNGSTSSNNFTFINDHQGPPRLNYITMVPPWISILAVLNDFVIRVNLSEANIFTDDSYKRDAALVGMLSNTGLKNKLLEMATNETDIRQQLSELKKESIKTNLLIASIKNLETYFTVAKPEMESKRFTWFVFTKDPTALQCENCGYQDIFSMTPTLSEDGSAQNRLNAFKDYVIKKWTETELYHGVNQIEISFFLDLTNIAYSMYSRQNLTGEIHGDYVCHNGTNNAVNGTEYTLTELMHTRQFVGAYGEYVRYQEAAYFQNVPVSFRRCSYHDARQCKKMGNWSVIQGIQEEYDSLLQDIGNIKHYRIATVVQPPFVEPKDGGGYQGYCIDLINEITKIIGFNYTIYEVKDKMYGTINEKNEWNGLIGELVSGEAEIALAPLSVMAERENYVDFTVPYYDLVGTTILMKRIEADYSLFKFMTVLEPPVWGCIVGAYFFTSFLLWVFDRFSPYSYTNNRDKYKDDPEKREFTFKECLWFCMTSLTPQGGGEAPKNISGRLVAATWWLFGFIIIASYTANLAAFLTVSRLEMPISSLDDLAKQYKIKYAPVRGTAAETYFRRMAEIEDKFYEIWKAMSLNESMTPQQRAQLAVWDYPVSDKFTNMWRYMQETGLPNSTDQAIEMVLKSPTSTEGFAYIGDATEIRYAELINCKLQKVGNEFSRKPYAIAVQQYSPLKDSISSAILKLLNQRTLESLKENWWVKNAKRKTCPRVEDESDGISIQNIGGVFIVILVGIALSIITLAFEYWYYKDKRLATNGAGGPGGAGGVGTNVQSINGQAGGGGVGGANVPGANNNNSSNVKDAHGVNGVMNMGHFNSAFAAKE